ncbi:MAG: hypothetical protein NZM26_02690 [Patescibacteria group bacterium]|nr:hypothetical protein [Patescibacteria group bacterium]
MRKEALFAVLAGILLGIVVAFGIWRTNNALVKTQTNKFLTEESSQVQQSATKTSKIPNINSQIVIAYPNNLDVFTYETVNIKGLATPNSKIVISNNQNDYITTTDTQGAFNQEISLDGGENKITIAIPESHQTNMTVFYSSELQKQLSQSPNTATQSAEQKAQEKAKFAELKIKAFMGTITDKSDTYLQMKNLDGTIQIIGIDAKTTAINEKTRKTIAKTDIAIGDYVVVLGSNIEDKEIKALRIIVSSYQETESIKLIKGSVIKTAKDSLEIQIEEGKEITLVLTKNAKIKSETEDSTNYKPIRLTDIKTNNKIIAVGQEEKDKFEARTIFRLMH